MPTQLLRSTAKKSHRSLKRIEGYWDQAKIDARKKFDKEDDAFWAYVNAIVQRRAGLRECSFKQFLEGLDDDDHAEVLSRTGFYGSRGAGCVIVCSTSGRILMPKRSKNVEQPGTWGTWGGAIDSKEDPATAARREVQEEAGYHGNLKIEPLFVFKHPSGFRYYNFLAIVDHEFKPTLNWETSTTRWCKFNDLPRPLHFGLQSVLEDVTAYKKLKIVCNS